MNRLIAPVCLVILLSVGGCKWPEHVGRAKKPNVQNAAAPVVARDPAVKGRLAAPSWTKKIIADGYQVEFPGEPVTGNASNVGTRKGGEQFVFVGFQLLKFSDSDLEILAFAMPVPREKYRSFDHFHDTFAPTLPAEKGDALGAVTKQTNVETNGKKGVELEFTKGGRDTRYRAFLGDKIYVVAAVGSDLAAAQKVIDRCFASVKFDAVQPTFVGEGGKPLPFDWRTWKDPASGYEIDMPTKVETQTKPGAKRDFERLAIASTNDPDLEFGVNAIRLLRRDKASVVEYLEEAKLDAPTLFKGGKLKGAVKAVVGSEEALELTITTELAPVICRVVRSPNREFGYEIFVFGDKLDEHRADVDRFFNSFKFKGRSVKGGGAP